MQQVTVRVPASTSNLGPGFDCLGVALRLYNDVVVTRGAKSQRQATVQEAADLFFHHARRVPFSFSVSITDNIPLSRGLGSSATVRLGALLALNALTGDRVDRLSIFQLCAQLEGHPDNAAPAILGGFTVVRDQTVQRFNVSALLSFVLLIPDFKITTSEARRILPPQIKRVAAMKNCANACAITAAFASGNYRNLRGAFADHLHQPFRLNLIPFLPRVVAAAEKAGALGAFLSGSGSTIAAVTLHSPKKVAAAMLRAAGSASAHTVITRADNRGARVLPFRNPQSAICN
jgi:homoserine kinase